MIFTAETLLTRTQIEQQHSRLHNTQQVEAVTSKSLRVRTALLQSSMKPSLRSSHRLFPTRPTAQESSRTEEKTRLRKYKYTTRNLYRRT